MANDLNQCNFTGRLGKDVEVRTFPSGDQVANFSIAVGKTWKNKDGEKQEKTEWINVSCGGGLAKVAGSYLHKGSQVMISGEFVTRKWQDNNGQDRYSTEIRADKLIMLGGKPEGQQDQGYGGNSSQRQPAPQRQAAQQQPQQRAPSGFDDMADDDIPFIDPMRRSLNLYNAI